MWYFVVRDFIAGKQWYIQIRIIWEILHKGSIYKDGNKVWGTHMEKCSNPGIVTVQLLLFLDFRGEERGWFPEPRIGVWDRKGHPERSELLRGPASLRHSHKEEARWVDILDLPQISYQVKTKWNSVGEGASWGREQVELVREWTWRSTQKLFSTAGLTGEW